MSKNGVKESEGTIKLREANQKLAKHLNINLEQEELEQAQKLVVVRATHIYASGEAALLEAAYRLATLVAAQAEKAATLAKARATSQAQSKDK